MFFSHVLSSWPRPPGPSGLHHGQDDMATTQRVHDRGHSGAAQGAPKSLKATPRSCSTSPIPQMGEMKSQEREKHHNAKASLPTPETVAHQEGKSLVSVIWDGVLAPPTIPGDSAAGGSISLGLSLLIWRMGTMASSLPSSWGIWA